MVSSRASSHRCSLRCSAPTSSDLSVLARGGDDLAERRDQQIEVGLRRDDRGREPDGLAVRLLGQDPLAQQGFGELTAGHLVRRDVDAGPQAARTYGVDAVPDQAGQPVVQLLAELRGALLEL